MENIKYIPGDLVKFAGKVRKITSIINETEEAIVRMGKDVFVESDTLESCYASLNPVPLTLNILEKNGWMHDGEDKYVKCSIYRNNFDVCHHYLIKYYHTQKECNVLDAYSEKNIKSGISYCHQLQHLLFGLGLNNNLKI